MYTLSTYNKHQHWDPILDAVSVLNTYVVYDDRLYLNSLDTSTLCTVDDHDIVVVRHERTNYVHTCYCSHAIQHITCYMCTLLRNKVACHKHITHLEDQISLLETCAPVQLVSFI